MATSTPTTPVPTSQEIVALKQFRAAVSELDLTENERRDGFLLRWLRAKDLNPSKAKEMLQKHLEYNKENDIANILSWEPPKSYHAEYPYEITGVTAEGCPLLVLPWGQWDVRKAVEGGQKEAWLKYCDYISAKFDQKMIETGVEAGFAVLDYAGFSMRQVASLPAVNLIVEATKRTDANNPFMLKTAFIINASKVFQMLFRFIKPVLSKNSLEILQVYGSDRAEWEAALLKHIPATILPVEYGGTLVLPPRPVYVPGPDEVITVDVKRGDKFYKEFQVEEVGTILKWRFRVELHDIGFSILYGESEKVREYVRVAAPEVRGSEETGEIRCEKPGKYTFIFDNGHSKFRGKTLHYNISMINPAEEAAGASIVWADAATENLI